MNTQEKMYETTCPHCRKNGTSYLLLNKLGETTLTENEYVYQSCPACIYGGKERTEHELSLLNHKPPVDRDVEVEQVWLDLESAQFCENNEILLEPFYIWGTGTKKDYIWLWFDQTHSCGVSYLTYDFEPLTEIADKEVLGTLVDAKGQKIERIYPYHLLQESEKVMKLWREAYKKSKIEHISKDSLLYPLVSPTDQVRETFYQHGHQAEDTLLFRVVRREQIDKEHERLSHTSIRLFPVVTDTLSFEFALTHACEIAPNGHAYVEDMDEEVVGTYKLEHYHSLFVNFYLETNTQTNSIISPVKLEIQRQPFPMSCDRTLSFQREVFQHVFSLAMEKEEIKRLFPLIRHVFVLQDWSRLDYVEQELLQLGVPKDVYNHISFVSSVDQSELYRLLQSETEGYSETEEAKRPFSTIYTEIGDKGQCLSEQGILFLNAAALLHEENILKDQNVFWYTLFYNLYVLLSEKREKTTYPSEEECHLFAVNMCEFIEPHFRQVLATKTSKSLQ